MTGLDAVFRDVADTVVGLFAGTYTVTFEIQVDTHVPSTSSRPTTTAQIYTVPATPRLGFNSGGDLQNVKEATIFVAAIDIEAATLTQGSGTVLAPRPGAKATFSDAADVWHVTAVQTLQSASQNAAYEVTVRR